MFLSILRIPAGASSFEAEDWDTGETISIALDPTKTPVEVAEGMYKRARKLRRAVDALTPLLAAAEGEVEYLEQLEGDLGGLAGYQEQEDLTALREVQVSSKRGTWTTAWEGVLWVDGWMEVLVEVPVFVQVGVRQKEVRGSDVG